MEAALFTLDCAVMVLLVVMSVRDDAHAGHRAPRSLFRMREHVPAAAEAQSQIQASASRRVARPLDTPSWAVWEHPAGDVADSERRAP